MTSNSLILNIVSNGYKIQFNSSPVQYSFVDRIMSKKTTSICKIKVSEFVNFKIIKVVAPSRDQFLSYIFPVPKKSGLDHRIIFDLTELNVFIRKVHFKMDSIKDIMDLIKPGDYFISIDLSDAYYCIAMHVLSMPFLTFKFLGVYYQFTCLPQGLSSAPRIFTKVMRVVMAFLRSRSIRIAAWIDDFLLASSSRALCQDHTFQALRTFEELGFLPNKEKSQLVPTQRICHLGLVFDSVEYSASVPSDKICGVRQKCLVALSSRVSLRFLSSILGSIEYFRWGFPFAALHYRRLQRFVNSCLADSGSYDTVVSVSEEARVDLSWWSVVGDSLPFRSLAPFQASLELFSDASNSGWGCWVSDGREAFGLWSSLEKRLHINVLECQAVLFGFFSFFRSTYNCSILINTDNFSVVAYVNHQGGTTSSRLCDLALELWDFCVARNISISACHVPGVCNNRADWLSRLEYSDHSYSLSQECFSAICAALPFPLTVDCFASRLNFKISKFLSRFYDPLTSGVNAFSVRWSDHVYLFPPIPLIGRVLTKFIADETGHGLLICPYWPSQSWFPSLLGLLIAPPLLIPTDSVLDECCRLPRNCRLVGWSIGCSPAAHMAFLEKLPFVGSEVLQGRPLSPTKDVGPNSVVGFVGGRVVTVQSL